MSGPSLSPLHSDDRSIRFGPFEVDPLAHELRRNGIRIKLQEQPFRLLLLLVARPGQLISRQEMIHHLWPEGTFVDFDHGLSKAIEKLRAALHDDPEDPRFIETVPKLGYRLVAPLERKAQPSKLLVTGAEPAPPGALSRYRLVGALALVGIIAGVGLLLRSQPWERSASAASRKTMSAERTNLSAPVRSIAVLPLDNLSGDPSQDYFAAAMTDELITELAKVGALRVTSRTTVTRYKNTSKTLPEIARELNVDGIVEGSVVRAGQKVRITAQLIHAPADQHLWADTYERNLGDVVSLQRDVAQAIAQQVHAQLTPELQAQFRSSHRVDPEAYEAYLKGRYYLYNQPITAPESLNRAKAFFEEATRKDPSFSLAYSGLANSYVFLVFLGARGISAEDGYPFAKQAVKKALELDPYNGEAYDVLGLLSWHADLDWKAAEEAFNRSITLAPSFSCGQEDRALFLSFKGRRVEALAGVEKSKQIDPGPYSALTESGVYFQLRDWKHLVEAAQRGLSSSPNEWLVHAYLGIGYEGSGKMLEAIAEYQKAVELSDGDPDMIASLGHAYAVLGRKTDAEKILHDLEQKVNKGKASSYQPATVYAGLGQKDKAFELLEKAYREKSFDVSWILKPDLRTENLRSDPRFQDLLRRAGLGT